MRIRGIRICDAARATTVRIGLLLVLVGSLTAGTLAVGSAPAAAHAPCSGGSHWDYIWIFVGDGYVKYWYYAHDHGMVYSRELGEKHRVWHLHEFDYTGSVYCGSI